MPDKHSIDEQKTTQFLTAIGDVKRLQILWAIGSKRINVGDIASQFSISRPAISHHLKILRDAKIVISEKIGQEVYYWLNTDHIVFELRHLADEVEKIRLES
jgi:ArsR family transcriptional regulator